MVMIVETSSNQLFDERPADGIDHAWIGTEVKRVKGGGYAPKANARPILVRKAGSRVIDSSNAPDPRDPRPDHEMIGRNGIFRDHNCSCCKDGKRTCVSGNPRNCSFLHARND
jgi:hypothetical protein